MFLFVHTVVERVMFLQGLINYVSLVQILKNYESDKCSDIGEGWDKYCIGEIHSNLALLYLNCLYFCKSRNKNQFLKEENQH